MNKAALLKLADEIEHVNPDLFDMTAWWDGDCGCAIGWGARLGALPDGLTLLDGVEPWFYDSGFHAIASGFHAIAAAYDIPIRMARRLFDPNKYVMVKITPADVARRIRESARVMAEDR